MVWWVRTNGSSLRTAVVVFAGLRAALVRPARAPAPADAGRRATLRAARAGEEGDGSVTENQPIEIHIPARESLIESEKILFETISKWIESIAPGYHPYKGVIFKRFEDYFWVIRLCDQLSVQINALREENFRLKAEIENGGLGQRYLGQRFHENLSDMIPATYKPVRVRKIKSRR